MQMREAVENEEHSKQDARRRMQEAQDAKKRLDEGNRNLQRENQDPKKPKQKGVQRNRLGLVKR